MRKTVLAAALACNVGSAYALQVPQPAAPIAKGGDPHVQVATCDPTQAILVVGSVGRPVTIMFDPGETIKNAVLPTGTVVDNKAAVPPWQGDDKAVGNTLPLWVTTAGRANAQVLTETTDHQRRVYALQLIALPPQPDDCPSVDCDDPRLTSVLTIKCPPTPKAPTVDLAAAKARAAAQQQLDAQARMKTDIFYGLRNWKYDVQGDPSAVKDLAPNKISDNSQVTGLLYLGNRKIPALYIVEDEQRQCDPSNPNERQVTPTPQQDLLVVYETARHWRLRKGPEVVDICNIGFDDIGANPYTGTTSPNVIRTIKADAK